MIKRQNIENIVKECVSNILDEAHSTLYRNAEDELNDFVQQNADKVPGLVSGYHFQVKDVPKSKSKKGRKKTGKEGEETYQSKVEGAPYHYTYRNKKNGPIDADHRYVEVPLRVGRDKTNQDEKNKGNRAVGDSSIFSLGNSKLGGQTLVFNMASALRCPAQRLCQVAKACYAKQMELVNHNYAVRNLRNQNMMKVLDHLGRLDLLFNLIKLHIIDCEQEGRRIDHVRLNEAGDFISPSVVKAFDDFAGEIKDGIHLDLPGFKGDVNHPITVTAYSAQGDEKFFEAFANVKNMVVNASLPTIKVGDDSYVKKFFYAISEKEYDALPDTDTTSTNNGEIAIVKPFKNTNIAKSGYYYKCPCEITDIYGMKRQCHNCKVCYNNIPAIVDDPNPNAPESVRSFFIVVKAHGSAKGEINRNSDEINASRKKMGEKE